LRLKRWVWDEVKILSTKLPDNVALCFTGAIGNLPVDVQLALHTLSMFGASTVKADYVKLLESKLNLSLQSPLIMAETEGLINHTNGYYTFCHDMIQETCHKMIAEHDRRSNHLIYGRCFISHHLDTDADDYLFAAVGQINSGGVSAISVPQEYVLFATYNLTAAKKAMQMNDFSFAHSLLIQAITFLQQNHWLQHYQLSLEVSRMVLFLSVNTVSFAEIQFFHPHTRYFS
jgi:predicted ATPase